MTIRPDQRYPLTWPAGWPRTPRHKQSHSPFKVTADKAYRELLQELDRLGARDVILSSNLKLRQDGAPYATQPRHDDEGIAVYFIRKGQQVVLACDKFHRREANMRAITKTIDAIRGIERWGSSDMMDRAFTGFTALPAPGGTQHWRDVLDEKDPEASYRRLRGKHHPDRGGDPDEFRAVQHAWDAFQSESANA